MAIGQTVGFPAFLLYRALRFSLTRAQMLHSAHPDNTFLRPSVHISLGSGFPAFAQQILDVRCRGSRRNNALSDFATSCGSRRIW